MSIAQHYAIVGAGMAGVACARTLVQAGHRVTLFEQSSGPGGRMATCDTEFGSFDHGTQYFTVRDPRFTQALDTVPGLCRRWSANAVRVLDPHGRVVAAPTPPQEAHWVPLAGMNALPRRWAEPLDSQGMIEWRTRVTRIAPDAIDPRRWQLHTEGPADARHVYSGFDGVLLAVPAAQAFELLQPVRQAPQLAPRLADVEVDPCWTLLLAFPQALQPGLSSLGPQWNAARSTHHRIAWLARESSKPGRGPIERWTVQASAAWSQEHLHDDHERVQAKLLKAFSEITGIHAEPGLAIAHRWHQAQTRRPLGVSHLWDAKARIGVCGDWCLGYRVEDAFVSGLELALTLA